MSTLGDLELQAARQQTAFGDRVFDVADEVLVREQLRRHVDRQLQRMAEHLLPRRDLMAGLAKHLVRQRQRSGRSLPPLK